MTDLHHHTEPSFVDEFRWVSPLHYLKNGWQTLFFDGAFYKRGSHLYTTTAPSCCIPASYCHLSATFQAMSIIVVNLKDNRAVFRIFIALLIFFIWLSLVHLLIVRTWIQCIKATSSFLLVCFWRDSPQWATASSFTRFLDHTQRRTKIGRTPLDEWSARRRDFYLTTHTTLTRDKRPYRRWDWNPQSQQASGRKPTP